MSDQFWWYVCRSTGIVAWALMVASMLWGTSLAMRARHGWVRPGWTLAVHRWLGTLTVVMVGVHLGALVADSYVTFTPLDLLVPFASDYRPIPVALGVLSLWLLVAVQFSARVLRRLPKTWWRVLHRASYALILTVSLHAALTGTDVTRPAYLAATVALILLPTGALLWRLVGLLRRAPRSPQPTPPTQSPTPSAASTDHSAHVSANDSSVGVGAHR